MYRASGMITFLSLILMVADIDTMAPFFRPCCGDMRPILGFDCTHPLPSLDFITLSIELGFKEVLHINSTLEPSLHALVFAQCSSPIYRIHPASLRSGV